MDAFNTLHFKGVMYNNDDIDRLLTITETREYDLDIYTMDGAVGISLKPSNGETTEVWSAITGSTAPGGLENFEFTLSVPDDYLTVEATATSVFVFSNGDEEISVTVNFVIEGDASGDADKKASVFAVEYDGAELEDGAVITVTEMDAFGSMHFSGVMYNDDKSSSRTLTITETREFDLDIYSMLCCLGISCVPSNGETTEVWSAITGATAPGGSENFEFKLLVPVDYQTVEATATSVFVFSNGDEEVSVTVNFVIAGE